MWSKKKACCVPILLKGSVVDEIKTSNKVSRILQPVFDVDMDSYNYMWSWSVCFGSTPFILHWLWSLSRVGLGYDGLELNPRVLVPRVLLTDKDCFGHSPMMYGQHVSYPLSETLPTWFGRQTAGAHDTRKQYRTIISASSAT